MKVFKLLIFIVILNIPDYLFSQKTSPQDIKMIINEISKDLNDSIIIFKDDSEVIKYSKNYVLSNLNTTQFFDWDLPQSPKETYAMSFCNTDKKFESEAGQDDFFLLYSFLFRKRNGEKPEKEREQLTKIYRIINNIFCYINHGGTYFGHQYNRIHAFVEYSIYLTNDNDYYLKSYNLKPQKTLYIQSFKQLIIDEVSIDDMTIDNDKKKRETEILKELEVLDSLITNYKELKCAQNFQYSNY